MNLTFVHSGDDLVARERVGNARYDRERIFACLAAYECKEINGSMLTEDERHALIRDARSFSMSEHVVVAPVFGSNERPWTEFGNGVPALLVYETLDGQPSCVGLYPHQTRDGRYHTIMEYVTTLGLRARLPNDESAEEHS